MAIKSTQVAVASTATRLDTKADDSRTGQSLMISNEGAADVRVGGPDVAMTGVTRGLKVAAGEVLTVELGNNDRLYGICASGTVDCTVLQVGVA